MRLLTPDHFFSCVTEIEKDFLLERGIRGLLLDFDETLVASAEEGVRLEIAAWVEGLKRDVALFIVSNNRSSSRVAKIADPLGLPFLIRAAKPLRFGFRKALGKMGLKESEVAVVGDQLFTDILGGRRLGALTILVQPLSPETVWYRKGMRKAEEFFTLIFGSAGSA